MILRRSRVLQKLAPCFLLLTLLWSGVVLAQAIPEVSDSDAEAWLVTFGPGQAYYERFGHNAIWLREPARGLDHTFNFGYFDFEQEDFFLRFLRGKMLYFSIAQPANREFEMYRQQDRSIRLQKLDLTTTQYGQLRDYLLNEIEPENRNYHYDYYLNNCSTRIRDALDLALNGRLATVSVKQPAILDFREQTRRLTQSEYWYYLGLEIGLALPVDLPVNRWEEMFIPMVVADEMASLSLANGKPAVNMDLQIFTSSQKPPPDAPSGVWSRYLLFGLGLAALLWLVARFLSAVWVNVFSNSWVLLLGSGGVILTFLWLATDHSVTSYNANLLLLNPLFLLAIIPAMKRAVAIMMVAGVLLNLLLLLLPVHQYNLDVLAFLAPVNLLLAANWLSRRLLDQ
jgi:hypothetical protein